MNDVEEKEIAEERAREASQKAYREELVGRNREDAASANLVKREREDKAEKDRAGRELARNQFKENARNAFLASPLAEEGDFEEIYPKILERHLLDETARILHEAAMR